jgi:LPXTG-motif cell wall-anchored protein
LTVTGSGFAPGGGVYVQFCPQPAGALGTAGGRATGCNPDTTNHVVWKTPIPADGTLSVELNVVSGWAGVDCTTQTCGVFVRKDHLGGATDYSQDAFSGVAFTATADPAPAPVASTGDAAATMLPRTGSSAATVAVAGVIALAVGLFAVRATRRKIDA